jgi:threonine/homoserine/homoserine lactone efflux protein
MPSLPGIFFGSFIIAFSGALMPGPLLTATIGESYRHGAKAGPLLIAGHAILEIVLVALLFIGLAPFLTNARITAIISVIGGCILFRLAFSMFRSLPILSLETEALKKGNHAKLITAGILVSLSNPYWSIWWATVGLAYILQARKRGIAGILIFFIGHIFADLLWYSIVSVSAGKSRKWLKLKMYKWIVGICAVFLTLFACVFFFNGIKTL